MIRLIIRHFKVSLILFVVVLFNLSTKAQSPDSTITLIKALSDQKYGSDSRLINGIKYYYPYFSYEGNPFLLTTALTGDIRVDSVLFEDQELQYDVLNEQLIMTYTDFSGKKNSIVLLNSWIREFYLGDRLFRNTAGESNEDNYLEVIYEGEISCYFDWEKEIILKSGSGSHQYYFTDASWQGILVKKEGEFSFKTRKSFLKVFDRDERKSIKQFFKEKKYRWRKMKLSEFRDLMEFCNQSN